MNHTPTPYKAEKALTKGEFCWNYRVRALDDSLICTIGPCAQGANMEFIIKACNAHDELVAALKGCLSWLSSYPGGGAMAQYDKVRKLLTTIEKGA